ncbi:acyl-CoA thioesterase [Salinisphaera sp. USBA-960]|nr:acyl-CoA thioesterase [Salifodinibacter halophilus]NNC26360.1 acyl-CoA thioesterase [Salifodinibacter halophilus]
MNTPSKADFSFLLPISVKWGEMDALGHVNNTVFFRYAEDGRIDYFHRLAGTDRNAWSVGPILADLRGSFQRQLHYPAEVVIGTRVARIGGSSMALEQALFGADNDTLFATFETATVWFDFKTQTSIRVDDAARARIADAEVIKPEM